MSLGSVAFVHENVRQLLIVFVLFAVNAIANCMYVTVPIIYN